jgi:cytochrome c-type biogenesis protein CcmF
VFLNPLMNWIWLGVGIVAFGTLVALVPNLTRTAAREAAVELPMVEAVVHHV